MQSAGEWKESVSATNQRVGYLYTLNRQVERLNQISSAFDAESKNASHTLSVFYSSLRTIDANLTAYVNDDYLEVRDPIINKLPKNSNFRTRGTEQKNYLLLIDWYAAVMKLLADRTLLLDMETSEEDNIVAPEPDLTIN